VANHDVRLRKCTCTNFTCRWPLRGTIYVRALHAASLVTGVYFAFRPPTLCVAADWVDKQIKLAYNALYILCGGSLPDARFKRCLWFPQCPHFNDYFQEEGIGHRACGTVIAVCGQRDFDVGKCQLYKLGGTVYSAVSELFPKQLLFLCFFF
jgi:hypothetical protein